MGQTLPDDHPFVLASAFSKYTLAITKRKEEEQRPTSVYDLFGPAEPVASLDTYVAYPPSLPQAPVQILLLFLALQVYRRRVD